MNTPDPRTELERLQRELESRQSTTHFAHAAVSLVVSLIFAGATAKLFWDSAKFPYIGILSALVTLGACGYGLVRYLRGKRTLREELARFEELKAVRRSLGMDEPSLFLPSR